MQATHQLDSIDWLRNQRHRVLNWLLGIIVVIGPFGIGFSIWRQIAQRGDMADLITYIVTYLLVVVLFAVRRIADEWRALGFVLLVYGFSVFAFISGWLSSGGRPFLLAVIAVSAVLISPRSGFVFAGISVLTYAALGLAYNLGWLTLPTLSSPASIGPIVTEGIGFTISVALVVLTPWFFQQALQAANQANRDAFKTRALLADRASELEQANRLLARRAEALAATAEISADVNKLLDQHSLLEHVVQQISERFQIQHAAILMLDTTGEWAVLQSASSKDGRRMAERGWRVRVGEGLIGQVLREGQARRTNHTTYQASPDLPGMRSEAALPLRARGEVMGVLDVQSQASEVLDTEQLAVLQTLADQIALAISNARLFEQVQASAEAERRAYGELSRQAWVEMTRARLIGYHYDDQGVTPLAGPVPSQPDNDQHLLALPLGVRGQTIGTLNASKPGGGVWTQEERALLQTLAEQLGTALESARLYQDTQRRATQEQLVGQVTARMRASLDIEKVLQTASEELYQALGLEELAISLTPSLDSTASRVTPESGNGLNR